ncbi:MAG: hypothetical protein LBN34_03120 [Clostridiales Family XIII bacterium]|jgi:hypothetical protein|nr:hypothetical protein [Clostridiales Family XIII bacterium]
MIVRGGVALTDDQAQCTTQLVIWILQGDVAFADLRATGTYATEGSAVLSAVNLLVAKAQLGFNPTAAANINMPSSLRAHNYNATYVRYDNCIDSSSFRRSI